MSKPREHIYMFNKDTALPKPTELKAQDVYTKKPNTLESYERLLRELERRPIAPPLRG